MPAKNLKVHFSSENQTWATPLDFFEKLNEEFGFDLDVCADEYNAKCDVFFDEQIDGLKQTWSNHGTVAFCNPPYKTSKDWILKASEEQAKGLSTVMLIPSRTDTKIFHSHIYNQPNVEIRFIKGRLKFQGAESSAPFPSMLVIFWGQK